MVAEETAGGFMAVMEADTVGVMEEAEETEEAEEVVTGGVVDKGGMRAIYICGGSEPAFERGLLEYFVLWWRSERRNML